MKRLTLAGCVGWGMVIGFAIWFVIFTAAQAQNRNHHVPCWPVPNGMAFTLQCANGYFHTTMPDGTIIDGVMTDPSATNPGSTIPMTDGGNIINRSRVEPPPPNQINAAPGQWYYYGGSAPE